MQGLGKKREVNLSNEFAHALEKGKGGMSFKVPEPVHVSSNLLLTPIKLSPEEIWGRESGREFPVKGVQGVSNAPAD